MKREVNDKTILDKFVEDFVKVIEKHCKYIIVSGFVAIAHGRSRGTEDNQENKRRQDQGRAIL